ncbi:MAG TPA: hypothetical protein PLB88_07700 [Thermoanaerobaculaceae bacterium]|nr:MAG: hypothetical protein B7Z61_08600 [Acidobacteria bacterium 37-71-11]HQT95241.1 hypothetical protein [Thermoanaerobaculaceae bacterium]HQU34183.1 hypothetical protein [Thermoanaerobaculaceae bacterium]
MNRTFSTLALTLLATTLPLLSACSSDSAATVSDAIVAGANRLKSSGQTQTTVRIQFAAGTPYVLVVYPPFRSAADEKFLETISPAALEMSHAGAAISPKAEGLLNTIVVWQKGKLATFNASFRSAAEAKQALGVVKQNGGAAEITLARQGGAVYIMAIK